MMGKKIKEEATTAMKRTSKDSSNEISYHRLMLWAVIFIGAVGITIVIWMMASKSIACLENPAQYEMNRILELNSVHAIYLDLRVMTTSPIPTTISVYQNKTMEAFAPIKKKYVNLSNLSLD